MKVLSIFFMLTFCSMLVAQPIDGFWKHVNSKTGETQCIISIYEYQDKRYGRMVCTFDASGKMNDNLYTPIDRAEKISGSPYYCGMDLLWDLQKSGSKFRGKIVDPRSGKIYSASIWTKNDNLIVRGELFFFGKSEVWYPVEETDFPLDFKKPDATQFIPSTIKNLKN